MSTRIVYGDEETNRLAGLAEAYMRSVRRAEDASEAAAVAEGFCPEHRSVLHPVKMRGGVYAGHCSPCARYWWFDPATGEVCWVLDHNPATGAWVPPPERPKQ
jgi:hypothetical protein